MAALIVAPAAFCALALFCSILFAQAISGDITTERPGVFSLAGAKARWDAWEALRGKPQAEARVEYVAIVDALLEKYGAKSGAA